MSAAPDYRYLACNALTNSVLDELPFYGETWSRGLNAAGTVQGNILLDGRSAQRAAQLLTDAEPGAITLYVERGGAYVWSGLLSAHSYDSEAGALSVSATEFLAYCDRRYYETNAAAQTLLTDDIANLANTFVAAVFADNGPPLTTSIKTAGVSTTMAFNGWEQHKLSDLLSSLASMSPGFDFSFDAHVDANGNPITQFTVTSPRRGVRANISGIVFDYPGGNVLKWTAIKDATRFATHVIGTGGGSGSTLVGAEAQAPVTGYVKSTVAVNNKDLTAQDQVTSFTNATLAAFGGSPPFIPVLTVTGDAFFASGCNTGDEFMLSIAAGDPYFPSGANVSLRCIGFKVIPGNDGTPETVEITCGAVVS